MSAVLVHDRADGVDYRVGGLIGDAVVAVREDDLAALGGEMGKGGLEFMNPCLVELGDLLCCDGIVVRLPVLTTGENDDRHISKIGDVARGVVDFGIAAATSAIDGAILSGSAGLSIFVFFVFHALVPERLQDGVTVGG